MRSIYIICNTMTTLMLPFAINVMRHVTNYFIFCRTQLHSKAHDKSNELNLSKMKYKKEEKKHAKTSEKNGISHHSLSF